MATALTRTEGIQIANDFAAALDNAVREHYASRFPTLKVPQVDVEPGRKYARIVLAGSQRSVHAFVDLTNGTLLKAEGWKKPAKHARFDLTDEADRDRCFASIDVYGAYLYLR